MLCGELQLPCRGVCTSTSFIFGLKNSKLLWWVRALVKTHSDVGKDITLNGWTYPALVTNLSYLWDLMTKIIMFDRILLPQTSTAQGRLCTVPQTSLCKMTQHYELFLLREEVSEETEVDWSGVLILHSKDVSCASSHLHLCLLHFRREILETPHALQPGHAQF